MMRHAKSVVCCLALLSLASCSTTNLVKWGQDKPSVYREPHGEVAQASVKPFLVIVGFPLAVAWDVATFPFQVVGGVHPYGKLMAPDHDVNM